MYDELVKKIRHCATDPMHCLSCGEDKDGRCFKRLMTQAADAIEDLEFACNRYEKDYKVLCEYLPKWIPVTERLPETGADVLVMFPHNMAVASRDMGEWVVNSGDGWCTDVNLSDDEKEPTHWMPLPEPPKEET